ncbi:myeloid-associated differentiation marker-like protein 2 [Astyanax mexicanus]|uniref:Myeloid-associated differentiation marker-like protein 2 n=1 Tax=Astyanax mexicanus TaxID=7994 RepID=A0A8T2M0U5_ASTMX|nr:myeloid-associated differentiation marker-like protein 2 [Astyanax mexicanus]
MGICSLSCFLKILKGVFCGLALLIPMFRGKMANPFGIWCEFVWTFGLVVAVVIFLLEMFLCDKIVELIVLKHSWADLVCGLYLQVSAMLLVASLIYCIIFVCGRLACLGDIFCAICSIVAFVLYTVDAVMAKLKCPSGYLSNLRGLLRFAESLVACVLLASVTDYFMGVEKHHKPAAMVWCIVVYVVCFPVPVLIILIHLIKLLGGLLCFALDRLEVIFNIIAVALYVSAAIIWPIFAYKNYNVGPAHTNRKHDRRFHDLNAATVLTYVNLALYVVDLILSVIALYKRI